MVAPMIILVIIPIFLGIVYVLPFDQSEKFNEEVISEHDPNILFFMLIGIWIMFLMRILLQVKKSTFKITQKY